MSQLIIVLILYSSMTPGRVQDFLFLLLQPGLHLKSDFLYQPNFFLKPDFFLSQPDLTSSLSQA